MIVALRRRGNVGERERDTKRVLAVGWPCEDTGKDDQEERP